MFNFNSKHPVFCVTTVSKYLALALFVALPFLGGYVGYTYAPTSTEVTLHDTPQRLGDLDLTAGENVLGGECDGYIPDLYGTGLYDGYYEWSDESIEEKIRTASYCYQGRGMGVEDFLFTSAHRDNRQNQTIRLFDNENIPSNITVIGFDPKGVYVAGNRVLNAEDEVYTFYDRGQYIRILDRVYTLPPIDLEFFGIYNNQPYDYVNLPGVDADTFEYIGNNYARDQYAVYYGRSVLSFDSQLFSLKTLSYAAGNGFEAGSITFGILPDSIYSNHGTVYFNGEELTGINPSEMYLGAGYRYVADSDTIYFFQFGCHGPATPVPGDIAEKDTYDTSSWCS